MLRFGGGLRDGLLLRGSGRDRAHVGTTGYLKIKHAGHHQDGERRSERQLCADAQILDDAYHVFPQSISAAIRSRRRVSRGARGRTAARRCTIGKG
jgi:hypothetical protein